MYQIHLWRILCFVAPQDEKGIKFVDYLTNFYVTEESLFPPVLWAEAPSHAKRTNNGPESFYAHFNEQFYYSHSSIYVFIYNVLKLQNASYIKIRNIKQSAPQSRFEKENVQLLIKYHQSYVNGEMSRDHYARAIGFTYHSRVDLKLVY
jgi:hypothetical protein